MSSPNSNTINRMTGSSPTQQNYLNFKPKKTFVKQLPFHVRHRRALVIGGGIASALIVFSAPIYYALAPVPENYNPRDHMWPGERIKGKTYAEQLREKFEKRKAEEEARAAAKANQQ